MADGYIAAALDTFHNAGFTAVTATPYVSLHSTSPGTVGNGELSGSGYARQALTLTSSSAGSKHNSADVVFGPASADWSVHYYGLWSAITGGTFYGYWTIRDVGGTPLVSAITINNTQQATFATGNLVFTLT